MEEGLDLEPIQRHLNQLTKKGEYQTRGLLVAIATGGLWPNARVAEAQIEEGDEAVSPKCPLCGRPCQDEMYCAWGCPVINKSADPRIQDTNKLAIAAFKDQAEGRNMVYWVRGLTPANRFPQRVLNTRKPLGYGDEYSLRNADKYATDGSGGEYSRDPRLRGCGAGIAVANFDHQLGIVKLAAAVSALVPGGADCAKGGAFGHLPSPRDSTKTPHHHHS